MNTNAKYSIPMYTHFTNLSEVELFEFLSILMIYFPSKNRKNAFVIIIMIITVFEQFCDYIFLEKRNRACSARVSAYHVTHE